MSPEIKTGQSENNGDIRRQAQENGAGDDFAGALRNIAASRGFESQVALARELGYVNGSSVNGWYRGINTPNAENFGKLLRYLKPSGEELESLVEPWRKLLEEGKAVSGNVPDTAITLRAGQKRMKKATTPFGMWIEGYCKSHQTTLVNLAHSVQYSNLRGQIRDRISVDRMLSILRKMPEIDVLTDEEEEVLKKVIAQEIVRRAEQEQNFSSSRIHLREEKELNS